MVESAVVFLLENLAPLVQQEVQLLSGFRNEVQNVFNELERVRAFLRAADAREEGDEEIRDWVKQVRDLAYDTEDVLDEFLLIFVHRCDFSDYGCTTPCTRCGGQFYVYLCKMAQRVKTLRARHRIASKLRIIKTRAANISEGRQRYGYRCNQLASGFDYLNNDDRRNCYELRSDSRLLEEAQLVGIDAPKKDLIGWLVKENPSIFQVVAVVGTGGLGKTTLVNQVHADVKVKKHFQHHAWVTVSTVFKLDDLLRQIVQQLYDGVKQEVPCGTNSANNHTLKMMIADFLRGKRYLIVLDDIWTVAAWDAIKMAFPSGEIGSRLMLTTRTSEVASSSTGELGGWIFLMEHLSEDESRNLFYAKAFRGNPCPLQLETISKNILRRCGGLPLAIVAIGGMLSTKDPINQIEEWEMVGRCVYDDFDISNANSRLKSMQEILLLSFIDLPYNLKYCFMYLSIFPEDYAIRRNKLVQLWIAEGFVQERQGRTLEEVGVAYFNELLNRSLIQVAEKSSHGRIRACRVHDFLREIILLKSERQNFAIVVTEDNQKRLCPQRIRRMSVHGTKNICARYESLRSLFFFGLNDPNFSISMFALFTHSLKLLKVLDCSGAPVNEFPKVVTWLYHLRFLSFRDTKVSSIPRSIRRLKNLQTLDLKDTNVREAPTEILQLENLRHLIIYGYIRGSSLYYSTTGFKAPVGIETLSSLQTLSMVKVDQASAKFIRSLGRLHQLRRLDIRELKEEDGRALCSSIENLTYLRSLYIVSKDEEEALDLQEMRSSPQYLQRVSMTGRLTELPHWISRLSSLVKLVLSMSGLNLDPLEALQGLPSLVVLEFVANAYHGENLCFKAGGFRKLKSLSLSKLGELRKVTIEEGAMPLLDELWLEDCKSLGEVPLGVEFLRSLRYLDCFDMADGFTTRLRRRSEGEDKFKIKHVSLVQIGYVRNGETHGEFL